MTAVCTKCGVEKPLDEYHRQRGGKNGRKSRCKPCVRAYMAKYQARPEVQASKSAYQSEYYTRNREAALDYQSDYHAENPHVGWESHARRRAHQHGYDITVERFTRKELIDRYGDQCFHCGGEFEELDHYPIPISRGGHHVIENCKPSCTPCNQTSWREETK